MDEKDVKEIPLYPYSGAYARAAGELEQFRASRQTNAKCRNAIDAAIKTAWDGMHLSDGTAKSILERFGAERVSYVLADTLLQSGYDGRFSRSNQTWAHSIPMMVRMEERWETPLTSHPDKINEFVSQARGELEKSPVQMPSAEILKTLPVYQNSMEYAEQHGESAQYFASHDANVACKEAINNAIAWNYQDNCLSEKGAKQIVGQYGFDRTFFVLAATIRQQAWDGRISRSNIDWANTQPSFENKDNMGRDINLEYVVSGSGSPGLTNLFLTQVREEYKLFQEQEKGQQRKEPEKDFRKAAVYLRSAQWAESHGEMEAYRASAFANQRCRIAIDREITAKHQESHLSTEAAKNILEQFGVERVSCLLAYNVQMLPNEGRLSAENRKWAEQIPTYQDQNLWGCVCRSHPALLNLFIEQTRTQIEQLSAQRKQSIRGQLAEKPPQTSAAQKEMPVAKSRKQEASL